MKAMFAGFAAIVLIGVAAYYGLHELGFSAQEAYSGPNVRVQ
ncbi:MAG: hypothetical protein RID15_06920 [Marinovum algicola]|jgi:predicted N-acetyltransferase YhbS|uniref:Uncharacterized protein n=1 Tax=Marinovum algicola TaxID=42444 RepID=A0A975ZPZ6_9RHOB|nr:MULTISPECIES: hypothetical protein [Marinovum]AKO99880.1 hypothetical protein MALG_04752 [Marinovum algicola DG 898]MDD9739456.1 hypothetical protein [Marinovum sp. SP66]SEJ98732.1 hypothetical protein SAMN04487940_11687 [Marinovum algicola]SLN70652.1 hypothetical protein MAA5396_03894 [Marinovum algicola]